jgi:hypothetical protein
LYVANQRSVTAMMIAGKGTAIMTARMLGVAQFAAFCPRLCRVARADGMDDLSPFLTNRVGIMAQISAGDFGLRGNRKGKCSEYGYAN